MDADDYRGRPFRLVLCFLGVLFTLAVFLGTAMAQPPVSQKGTGQAGTGQAGTGQAGTGQKDTAQADSAELAASAEPFSRPVYAVGVKNLHWTRGDGAVAIEARAYYPIGALGLCPAVIYSHGLGGSVEQFEYLGRRWASRGMISIHLRHAESDAAQWRGKLRPKNELKELYQLCWSGRDRALMIRFALDRLTEIAGKKGTVGEHLDLRRVGVAGNDLGALAALLVAGQLPPDNGPSLKDDRISAVLAISPPVYCTPGRAKIVYGEISVPFLSVAGTRDDGVIGTTKAAARRIPYDAMTGNARYHVTLEGGDQMVYAGHLRTVKQGKDPVYQNAIRNISLLFWSAYLQDDSVARSLLSDAPEPFLANVGFLEKQLR